MFRKQATIRILLFLAISLIISSAQADDPEKKYNEFRPQSEKYCYGKTPLQTFNETKHIAIEKNHGNINESADSQHTYDNAA